MAYLFFSFVFVFLVISTVLYITRSYWLPRLPDSLRPRLPDSLSLPSFTSDARYTRLPSFALPSFRSDAEAGLTSSTFDLNANIIASDSRAGLDAKGKLAVQNIMKKQRVNFDEARRIYTQSVFERNNIGADGRPRDPKFVSFS